MKKILFAVVGLMLACSALAADTTVTITMIVPESSVTMRGILGINNNATTTANSTLKYRFGTRFQDYIGALLSGNRHALVTVAVPSSNSVVYKFGKNW